MDKKCAVILAAGEGTRMKSKKPKALAEVLFAPMIDWVIGAVKESGIDDICVVKGFGAEYLDAHPGIGKGIGRIRLISNLLLAAALLADFFLLAVFLPAGVFFLAASILMRILFARKYKASYIAKHFSPDLMDRKKKAEEQSRLAAQLRLEKEKFIRSLQ